MPSMFIRSLLATVTALALVQASFAADNDASSTSSAGQSNASGKAAAMQTPTQWDLGDLYPTPAAWNSAYDQIDKQIGQLDRFKGKLAGSPQALGQALDAIFAVQKSLDRLSLYASLKSAEDLRNADAQERAGRAERIGAHFNEATGYVQPELTRIDPSKLRQWAAMPALAQYQHYLSDVIRNAPHTLSPATESALAAMAPAEGGGDTFQLLSSSDIDWPKIRIDGKDELIDQSGYTKWRSNNDRDVRKRVFDAFWSTYQQYQATFGSLLGETVQAHVISARLHHYPSAVAAALAENDIPVSVYHQLVTSVNANLPTLYRYLNLRKRMLGVDTLHYYDIYPPLVKSDRSFTIDQARSLVREATQPLGSHYAELLDKATSSPWTTVYPSPGKSPGAFENGTYGVHPYVLLNFNKDYEGVTTYAHEWGHGVHTMLADAAQPYPTSSYPIFTAEVASTTNETLLVDHMIATAKTDQEKLYYIGQALEQIRGTFFRQAQFAEFELAIHEAAQKGQSLSGKRLTQMYADILDKYYGVKKGVTQIDPTDDIEWAYIPHFYYNFYVYQYATSFTAGHYFASQIEKGNDDARKAYLNALSSGGSKSGYVLLKNAGVDLDTAKPYQTLIAYMNSLIDQANAILDKSGKSKSDDDASSKSGA